MKHFSQRTLTIFALAMLGSVAIAQDEPAPDETAPVAPKLNTLKLRYTGLWSHGNSNSLRHRGTLANGFAISELSYGVAGSDVSPFYRVTLHDVPDRDYTLGGLYIRPGGDTEIDFGTRHRQYHYNGLTPTDSSEDNIYHVGLSQRIGDGGAFVTYDESRRTQRPESPRPSHRPRVQQFVGGLQGRTGALNAGITVSQSRFTDGTGLQPTTVNQMLDARVSGDIGPNFSFVGSATFTRTHQNGLAGGGVRNFGVAGSLDLGDRSTLHFDIGRQDISMPNVLSDYDRKRYTAGARFITNVEGWALQAGIRHREAERVRADRTFVDVPAWNTFDFRLARQVYSGMRLTLRGTWDNLTAGAVPNTDDTRQLLWDDKVMGQAKLDFSSDSYAFYAVYTYRFRQNKTRLTEIDWHNITIGASHPFNSALTAYGEVSYDTFRGGERVEGTNERLSDFFPNSANLSAGFTYSITPTSTFSAGVNAFSTNNLWGSLLTTSYRRQLADDRVLEIAFSPWSTHDRLLGQSGYSVNLFSIQYSIQF